MIGLCFLGIVSNRNNRLAKNRPLLWIFVFAITAINETARL